MSSSERIATRYKQYRTTPAKRYHSPLDVVIDCGNDDYPWLKIALLKRLEDET